jgi:hypothetical protein
MKIVEVAFSILLIPVMAIVGCNTPEKEPIIPKQLLSAPGNNYVPGVEITDAYCIDTQSSKFPYRFTLKNLKDETIELVYYWSLNEPMADAQYYQGQGKVSLPAFGAKEIEVQVKINREYEKYDPRFYVMYVSVYQDDTQIGYYRGQKSTYDYDYSTLPPNLLPIDMTGLISISPNLGEFLIDSRGESPGVLLKDIRVVKDLSDNWYIADWCLVNRVDTGELILIINGSIQNTRSSNIEIEMYAEGYDANGKQVSWTLDYVHNEGRISLHLEKEQIGNFTLHLNMNNAIKSLRIFANSYPVASP